MLHCSYAYKYIRTSISRRLQACGDCQDEPEDQILTTCRMDTDGACLNIRLGAEYEEDLERGRDEGDEGDSE
jgi:hypothetical protein